MTDVKTYLDPAEEKMEMAVAYLDESLAHIRAGKANPKILDGIRVEYYGSAVPIGNVANVSVPGCPYYHHHPVGEGDVQGNRKSNHQFRTWHNP